jgi:hypothetical protein
MSKTARVSQGRTRLGIYTISEVFDYIDASPKNGQRIKFRGHFIHMRSVRMLNFRINGIRCVNCGRRAAFFAKERYRDDPPYLYLYGFTKSGRQLLFTVDHIKPKIRGGSNALYNIQTMCARCNGSKSDNWDWKIKLKYYCRKFAYIINKKILKKLRRSL